MGLGSLGQALMRYEGFANYGLGIVAAFDPDPPVREVSKQPGLAFPLEKLADLADLAGRMRVKLGILAVPGPFALVSCDLLVEAGIRGLWDFAPVNLKVPGDVIVKREDISLGLAILSYRLIGRD